MSINIAEKLARREAYNHKLKQENKLNDIELLANALDAAIMKEYFDIETNGSYTIKRDCAFLACDKKTQIATTYCMHGYTPWHDKTILSLTVSEPRPYFTDFTGLLLATVDFDRNYEVMTNREIDMTISIAPNKFNLQVIGSIAFYAVAEGKRLYLIKDIDKIDVITIH